MSQQRLKNSFGIVKKFQIGSQNNHLVCRVCTCKKRVSNLKCNKGMASFETEYNLQFSENYRSLNYAPIALNISFLGKSNYFSNERNHSTRFKLKSTPLSNELISSSGNDSLVQIPTDIEDTGRFSWNSCQTLKLSDTLSAIQANNRSMSSRTFRS